MMVRRAVFVEVVRRCQWGGRISASEGIPEMNSDREYSVCLFLAVVWLEECE